MSLFHDRDSGVISSHVGAVSMLAGVVSMSVALLVSSSARVLIECSEEALHCIVVG